MESHQFWSHATYRQLKLLVRFMGHNGLLARGVDCRTAIGRYYHDDKWSYIAEFLNEQKKGMKKSPREWNMYWKELKSFIMKEVKRVRHNCRNTKLNGIEQIIYQHYCERNNIRTKGFAKDILKFTMPNPAPLQDIFNNKTVPRTREVTSRQILHIIKFISKHPKMKKPNKNKFKKQYHDEKWVELAHLLNVQHNGPIKSSEEWISYWNGIQNEVRWKVLRGTDLSKGEKFVYEDMCENKNTECKFNEDTASIYTLRVVTENESGEEVYEVEYFEENHENNQPPPLAEEVIEISDDAQFIDIEQEIDTTDKPQEDCNTNGTVIDPVYNVDSEEELSNDIISQADEAVGYAEKEALIDMEQEIHTSDEPQKDGNIHSKKETTYQCTFASYVPFVETAGGELVLNGDIPNKIITAVSGYAPFIQIIADKTVSSSDIRNKIMSSFSTNAPFIETVGDEPVSNNDNPNIIISDINSTINNSNSEVLQDIRNELKALVKLQKDKAKSAQRLAAAQVRKADLEEKKVGLEERRLKMEERRLHLQEKNEAGKRYSFPKLHTT